MCVYTFQCLISTETGSTHFLLAPRNRKFSSLLPSVCPPPLLPLCSDSSSLHSSSLLSLITRFLSSFYLSVLFDFFLSLFLFFLLFSFFILSVIYSVFSSHLHFSFFLSFLPSVCPSLFPSLLLSLVNTVTLTRWICHCRGDVAN